MTTPIVQSISDERLADLKMYPQHLIILTDETQQSPWENCAV